MKKKIFLAVFLCCGMFAAMAQTAADSLAIVSADWQTEPLQKGMLYKKAVFSSLYGVPQEGAVAAINGSYFDMKAGNSVCYLRKDGVVIDTTSTGVLATVSNGAVLIKKGRLELIPWSKQEEKACTLKKGTVLASGPLMLKDGQVCNLSGTNRNFVDTKHPRSAVALTREGKILLIVVDGRRKGKAEGINIPELAHMIRVLGGEDALNLDGGGSSTLWSGELPDKGIANTPSGSAERKVANSLCVYE